MHLSALQTSANIRCSGLCKSSAKFALSCSVNFALRFSALQSLHSDAASANCKLLRHGENRAGAGPGQVEAGCRPNEIQLYMDIQIQIHIIWTSKSIKYVFVFGCPYIIELHLAYILPGQAQRLPYFPRDEGVCSLH